MPKREHLFSVTLWSLRAATWFCFFVGATLVVALGALGAAAMNLDGNYLGVPANAGGMTRNEILAIAPVAVSGILACIVLVVFGFRATIDIVKTAISGDPFINENAERLSRIGWLLLAVNVVQVLTKLMIAPLTTASHGHFGFDFEVFPPPGLLAVLLIFVLAQIFRRGAEMRAELEGTV